MRFPQAKFKRLKYCILNDKFILNLIQYVKFKIQIISKQIITVCKKLYLNHKAV